MAVCNIFSPLSNPTGNFIMFSNYADDMNKYRVLGSNYRVVPSKFYVLDIDYANVPGIERYNNDKTQYNQYIPSLFQNTYENWVAYTKNNSNLINEFNNTNPDSIADTPHEFYKRLYWAALTGNGVINNTNIKYIGDIALESYDDHLNDSYGEIVCHIPSQTESYSYPLMDNLTQWDNSPNAIIKKRYIEGYQFVHKVCPESTTPAYADNESALAYKDGKAVVYNSTTQLSQRAWIYYAVPGDIFFLDNKDNTCTKYICSDDLKWIEDETIDINIIKPLVESELSDNQYILKALNQSQFLKDPIINQTNQVSYKFNTVLVFYDIIENDAVIYKDLPMGIYFTGIFDENGVMSNQKTIYKQNKDIFGTSTTYALRICTRYTVNPNRYGFDTSITISDNDYTNMSTLLSKMADNIDMMNDILKATHAENTINKDLYNIFKNGQVNVPYIKEIDGVQYWFVNGKLITQISYAEIPPKTITETFDAMKNVYNEAPDAP